MPLDLNQLLKKAKDRGINPSQNSSHKPWYEESKVNLDTSLTQTVHKPNTNLTQTVHKPNTNLTQTVHKPNTNLTQTVHKPDTNLTQTVHKPNTEPNTEPNTTDRSMSDSVNQLEGIQKKLIEFFYEHCKMNVKGITPCLKLEYISENSNIQKSSIKTSIQRLIKKGLLKKIGFKDGRSGWVQFTLEPSVYHEMFQLETMGNLSCTSFNKFIKPNTKPDTKPNTKPDTLVDSSSSINIYKTTNYTPNAYEPQDEFKITPIDIEPLAQISLTNNHVSQILKLGRLSPDQIQESINHFAFDLNHTDKAKTFKSSPVEVFMGILRKGNYYNAPANYESQEIKNQRLYLEDKIHKEKTKKMIEDSLIELEYQDWSENLTEQELADFYAEDKEIASLPEKMQKTLKRRNALNNARKYFESEIWPKKKKEIESKNFSN